MSRLRTKKANYPGLMDILATLHAMRVSYQHSHWTSKGPMFFSRHQLFAKLYNSVAEELDLLAEKMVGISEPLPDLDPPPPGAQAGWQPQVGMSLKCLSGEDKGMEARYAVTSVGGKRAMHALALKIAEQVDTDQTKPVAVVKLGSDHYAHKSYGRVYTPTFDIVEWISIDGDGADDVAPAAESTTRRRRS